MSIQQQEDAASALASLTLQPTQESQDSQESLQPTQETQDSQENQQPTQESQDSQESQEMDEDDILQAQLQQSLGGGLAANAIAGELDQHTAQSLAKDKARERKTRPAAGPNYFLKFDPDVPFVPQEFYNMEEGLPPRWDGAGKEDGLDHKDKYESYMSVGNHNTGPAEWASVIKSRAGQDGVYWGEEVAIERPKINKRDEHNATKVAKAKRGAWKDAFLKSVEGKPWHALVDDMADFGFSSMQMGGNDCYMDIKKACIAKTDSLWETRPEDAKLFGTEITITHTNRDESGNRKSFIFCRRCSLIHNVTNATSFKAQPIGYYRYLTGDSATGTVKGGIELLEVYPHNIDCIRPVAFGPAYVTSREANNKGLLHLPLNLNLMKLDNVFGGFVQKLVDEGEIDLDEIDSDKTGPSGHLMNYGCPVRYPYDTRKYWHMPLTTSRHPWKLDNEEDILEHCRKYQEFLRKFTLFFMVVTNSVEQFTDRLSPWKKTWPPRRTTVKPHLFFSHGTLVFDGRTNLVHRESGEHEEELIHQPCHFPHFASPGKDGVLLNVQSHRIPPTTSRLFL